MDTEIVGATVRYYPTPDGVGCAVLLPNGAVHREEVAYAECMTEELAGADVCAMRNSVLDELGAYNFERLDTDEVSGRLWRKFKRRAKKIGRKLSKAAKKVKRVAKKVAKSKAFKFVRKVAEHPAFQAALAATGPIGAGIAGGIRLAQTAAKLAKAAKKGSKVAKAAVAVVRGGKRVRRAAKKAKRIVRGAKRLGKPAKRRARARAKKLMQREKRKLKRTVRKARARGLTPKATRAAMNLAAAAAIRSVERGAKARAASRRGQKLYEVRAPSGKQYTFPV